MHSYGQNDYVSQGIVNDNRCWAATRCIICNQRSDFLRCNPRRQLERPVASVISNYLRTYEGGVLACDGADSESQLAACGSVSDLSDDLP